MDPALVAVIGTLSGVLITAGAGLLTAWVAGRNQRELTQAQLSHDEAKAMRQERRKAYVEFLEAYDQVFRKAQTLAVANRAPDADDFQQVAEAELHRLTRAYIVVTITAGAAVRAAAAEALATVWNLGEVAVQGRGQGFRPALDVTREPRHQIRAAMRAELGVNEPSESEREATPNA